MLFCVELSGHVRLKHDPDLPVEAPGSDQDCAELVAGFEDRVFGCIGWAKLGEDLAYRRQA